MAAFIANYIQTRDPDPISDDTTVTGMNDSEVHVELHPLREKDAVLVRVTPPTGPPAPLDQAHVPCDVVLVIDVSGSMGTLAPAPSEEGRAEQTGLTVLDLVKHSAKVIVESLGSGDRLGIVTFDSTIKVVQRRTHMTKENKALAVSRIEELYPKASTNLWGGIREGLKLFESDDCVGGNVPALIVLTDGQPNYMCPPQGYLPKLRPILKKMVEKEIPPITINTFGFGYSLRSGLLQCLAKEGNGAYSYIPDAGMLGTVFVHSMANLFNTYAVDASLTFDTSVGFEMSYRAPDDEGQAGTGGGNKTIKIGNIQYGQSRDLVLPYDSKRPPASATLKATLRCYGPEMKVLERSSAVTSIAETTTLPAEYCQYQRFRTRLCRLLASLFPASPNGENRALEDTLDVLGDLKELATDIETSGFIDPLNTSLFNDIRGPQPMGQVKIALMNVSYWKKWGIHYLPSLLSAHSRQVCNSFKDSGPLQYGAQSPVFTRSRDLLDELFDNMPAPIPSGLPSYGSLYSTNGHGGPVPHWHNTPGCRSAPAPPPYAPVRMSRYRNVASTCFAGHCPVDLADGTTVKARDLRPGMSVWTPAGANTIRAVIATRPRCQRLCRVGKLIVTAWHPMRDAAGAWVFPIDVAEATGDAAIPVYSLLLDRADDPDMHAVRVGGVTVVTLGHGVTTGEDVRAHAFFGDWNRVNQDLVKQGLLSPSQDVQWVEGVWKDTESGLACGFLKDSTLHSSSMAFERLLAREKMVQLLDIATQA